MMIKAGSIIRYQANVSIPYSAWAWSQPVTPDSIRAAITSVLQSKGASLIGYLNSSAGETVNIQANIKTNIDRNNLSDITYDVNGAIVSAGATILGGTGAAQLTSLGGQIPGTIPAPIQGDTHHDGDTIIGTAGSFWFDQIGQQVQGAIKALGEGSPMMWIGIGVVALILFSRK